MSNDSSHWRSFEETELTHSAAHYLLAILNVRKKQGYARITDVADYLKVSRGAASKAISILRDRDYICEDPNRMLELTNHGQELVHRVERNYTIAERLFVNVLQVDSEIASSDACKLEHLLSSEVSEALFKLVRILDDSPELMKQIREKQTQFADDSCIHDGSCPVCKEYDGCMADEFHPEEKPKEEAPAK